MFSTIKTSRENKEIITELTRKYDLKSENVIARIALAYSLENDGKLDLSDMMDSGGKEYSKKVLFGKLESIYLGMVCALYQCEMDNILLKKILKAHLDKGITHISCNQQIFDIL